MVVVKAFLFKKLPDKNLHIHKKSRVRSPSFNTVEANRLKKWTCFYFLLGTSLLLIQAISLAQPNPSVAGIGGILNLTQVGACMSSFAKAGCQNDIACVTTYFQTHDNCQQVNSIYQYTGSWPVAIRDYTGVSVVKLESNQFLIIDSTGKFILPSANLSLESAPGFLALKTTYPTAQLTNKLEDFPVAVYLSETNNQLLFLQAIIAPPCQTTCPPVAVAKVLYGFSVTGEYSGANVLRIVSPNS